MGRTVNLRAYFERIGFAGSIAPTLATLEALAALQPAVIPFENLDVLLGQPISLDLEAIERKLVHERRGGYCFEHNHLLMAVLRELDFAVRPLSAQVLWNRENSRDVAPTHMLLAIDIGGATYLADPGFGGMAPTAPLRLKADAEQATPHETFRLIGGEPDWQLEVKLGEAWRPLYRFGLAEASADQLAKANSLVSEDPEFGFRDALRVALSPPGRRLALHNTRLTIRPSDGEPVVRDIESVEEIRAVLDTEFGMALPEAAALDPQLETLLARPAAED